MVDKVRRKIHSLERDSAPNDSRPWYHTSCILVWSPLDMIVKDSLTVLKTFQGTYYSHFQISHIHFGVLFPTINQKCLIWAIQALQNKLFSTSAWRGSLPSPTCPHLWLRLGRAHSLVISLSLTTSASYQKRLQIAFILNKIIIIKKS